MTKNIAIVVLTAIIAFMAMDNGDGVLSAQEVGTPIFVTVLGLLIVMMTAGSKE